MGVATMDFERFEGVACFETGVSVERSSGYRMRIKFPKFRAIAGGSPGGIGILGLEQGRILLEIVG